MAISIRLYELMPPVKTSFNSLCNRNCFKTKIKGGRTGYFYKKKNKQNKLAEKQNDHLHKLIFLKKEKKVRC